MKILANDGIEKSAVEKLTKAGFVVTTEKIAQENLAEHINKFEVLTVRSATKVRKELIDKMTNIKLIIRAGVGMDNIDVAYAESKGIAVRKHINIFFGSDISAQSATNAYM